MEVPLDLTSRRDSVWPDSDVGSAGSALVNSPQAGRHAGMEDALPERRAHGAPGEGGSVLVKEEAGADGSEDDEPAGDLREVEARGVPATEAAADDAAANKDEDTDAAGFVSPDVKPSINISGLDRVSAKLSMPLLNDGEEAKVDGGTAAFLCETMMSIAPDKRGAKIAKHYAAIRANETAEAIEALKKALHREKNFACGVCGNLFKDRRNLGRHVKRIHCDDKKYRCETCGKGFCFVSHLLRHAESHSAEKRHVCGTCGRGFNLPSNLERHMITHSREKPYACPVCGARFSQNYYLQAHAVVHTGEKRFECATCGMKFGNRSNLRRHFRSHSSEKPYACPVCDQRFRFSNNISKHRKKYHKAT
ncbi:zinc finger protein 468-like [Bacillus rossius redtenbacheri]|uniref:zinc finger protein 468-like n=1 Tax=Bacillus rossius redtenbacheri TaxID=93214 RepID=UPI002FDE13CA